MHADVTTLHYWIDLAIKAVIGVVVSIVGMDYRSVKNSLHELEQAKYSLQTETQVIRVELTAARERLGIIDQKLDSALKR